MLFVNILFILLASLVSIPIVVVFVEAIAAWFVKENEVLLEGERPSVTVLIPAHNESAVITSTLKNLKQELAQEDNVLVIADNCSDNTADLVREQGYNVVERFNDTERGKGFALDHGLTQLEATPPEQIIILDADCLIDRKTVDGLLATVEKTGRPVQATYLLSLPDNPGPTDYVSAFAFLVKNRVRPQGLHVLRQPCLLTGTGMAFPWKTIRNAPLASGNIVEDMQLSLDLALEGSPVSFLPNSLVRSVLPGQREAAVSQRTRWEHGHLNTLLTQVPRLLRGSIVQRRIDLLSLALDLAVPPLALLVMLWGAVFGVTALIAAFKIAVVPFTIMAITGILLFVAIGISWFRFGRSTLPKEKLLSIPLYVLWKIPMYVKYIFQRQSAWVRTERDTPNTVS